MVSNLQATGITDINPLKEVLIRSDLRREIIPEKGLQKKLLYFLAIWKLSKFFINGTVTNDIFYYINFGEGLKSQINMIEYLSFDFCFKTNLFFWLYLWPFAFLWLPNWYSCCINTQSFVLFVCFQEIFKNLIELGWGLDTKKSLDEAVWITLCNIVLGKGMNPSLLLTTTPHTAAKNQSVGQTRFFNVDYGISIEESKLWVQTRFTLLKSWSWVASKWKRWFGWLGFYGIFTTGGYLIPNPLYIYIYIYMICKYIL